MELNLIFGWIWIGIGFLTGTLIGLKFHEPDWLGGYTSLARRMIRLGHIAFTALGGLNVLAALSLRDLNMSATMLALTQWTWIGGAVFMPLCCYATAYRRAFRHTFALPVTLLVIAIISTVTSIASNGGGAG